MISSLELARICGVSQGTVDRALHDRSGVSAKTRSLVLAAAARHGYVPNPAARELMTGASSLVVMVLPRLDRFFMMDLAEAVKRSLAERGLRLLLATAVSADEAAALLADFAARRYRAVVIIPPSQDFRPPEGLFTDIPLISLLERCPGTRFVHPDEAGAGVLAAEYFAGRGHQAAIHLSYSRESWAIRTRAESFARRAAELGMRTTLVRDFDQAVVLDALKSAAATAIFCHNDWLAYQTVMALEKAGIEVPGDVSVLGVDNSPSFNEFCPGITTLEYPFAWTAAEVAAIIATGRDADAPCPPFKLIER